LLEFLDALNNLNVSYVSWKNNHEIELALSGRSDLDILIFDTSLIAFNAIANTHGWLEVENPVAKFDSITHYFNVNRSASVRHLHVYFEVITGDSWLKEYRLPLKEFLFKNRIIDVGSGIWVLNDTSQAYIFFIRHMIKSGSAISRLLYARELDSYNEEWCKCKVSVDQLYGVGPIPIDDWIKDSGLLHAFRQPKYSVAYKYRQYFRLYLRYKSVSLPFRRVVSLFRRATNKLLTKDTKKFKNGGVVVAISGADGAGKSTMILGLQSHYSAFLNCKVSSLGKPQGKFLEFLRSLIRKRDKSNSTCSNSRQKQSSIVDAILAAALGFLRLRKALAAVKKAGEGNMVLADRWPTISLGKMDGPKIVALTGGNRLVNSLAWLEQWIYKKIPQADICFYFIVEINEARKRNFIRVKEGKETDQEIVMRHENNQDIFPIANKLIQFSNNGSYEEMFPILAHDIWDEMVSFKQSSDRR
jgi:thymidylate kinase